MHTVVTATNCRRSCGGVFGSSLSPGMGHRIEVELTSQSDETTWTWRAAGAKLPRGTVDAGLVPAGSAVGTVLRAEVETTLDGTTVTALLAPKGKSAPKPVDRIEVVGTPKKGPDVTWSWPARASVVGTTTATATAHVVRPGVARVARVAVPVATDVDAKAAARARRVVRDVDAKVPAPVPVVRAAPARHGRVDARADANVPSAATVVPRPRPSSATQRWPSCNRSNCRSPSSCSRVASPPCARPFRNRTRGPGPKVAPR